MKVKNNSVTLMIWFLKEQCCSNNSVSTWAN